MNGGGYGICGHKNSYNAGVKDGNWVEDKIGQDLAANRPRPQQTIVSELQSSYIDPVCMPWKQSIEVVVADTQNRKGLNKEVLFNHGADIFASDDDFPSSDSCKRLMRARSDILQKEQYQVCFPPHIIIQKNIAQSTHVPTSDKYDGLLRRLIFDRVKLKRPTL